MRVSGQATGIVQFDFPAHPLGTNYVFTALCASGNASVYTTVARTSTRIAFVIRDSVTLALADRELIVTISAY
jgi:hypothetical protein